MPPSSFIALRDERSNGDSRRPGRAGRRAAATLGTPTTKLGDLPSVAASTFPPSGGPCQASRRGLVGGIEQNSAHSLLDPPGSCAFGSGGLEVVGEFTGRLKPDDFVFCSTLGRPLHHRNVQRRGMDKAVERAKLDKGKHDPTMHDLRHSFASLLIAQGLDVVFVSRQLGHANPATTLRVYASEFDRVRSAEAARSALSAQFGSLLDGNALETAARNPAQEQPPTLAVVPEISG